MKKEQPKRDASNSDGVAQQPGLTGAESSGSSGLGGKQNRDAQNSSSGAMDGQGTFRSGANGPGMKQTGSSENDANLSGEKRD